LELDVPVPSPRLWSPESPNLYRVEVTLRAGDEVLDALSERVGFVKLSTRGKHFCINGEPYFLRGSGDFVINPETGCPDTDRERWRRKLRTLRDYGYNCVRLQSYAAAPEYYDVADEVGLLVQSEMGMLGAWGGHAEGRAYGWPQPSPEFYPALKWHWDKTVLRDVNHPSANLYCMANELHTNTNYPKVAWECYHATKDIKPSAFVIWSDGNKNPSLPADFVNAEAGDDGKWDKPLIQHEFRWWTSYPDVRIKAKYAGAVRPYAIELAEATAAQAGMTKLLPEMAANSQRLQYVEARGKMEACRRDHPTLAGISHFCAMDAGLAVEGIFDDFYGQKHVDAATWRRTNGDTALLISRNFDDRVLASGETFKAQLLVSDFGHPPFQKPMVEWEWTAGRGLLASGRVRFVHLPHRTHPMGELRLKVPDTPKPLVTTLRATLREGSRRADNEWTFWVFPTKAALPASAAVYRTSADLWLKDVQSLPAATADDLRGPRPPKALVSETRDEAVMAYVANGGRLVLAHSPILPRRPFQPKLGLTVGRYFFTPPANYRPFEAGNAGTIIRDHPMLGDVPHEGFADLQFYRMIAEMPPLDLAPFATAKSEPVIRSLSTYFVCHPVGYLVEFAVGKGGVIFCGLDLNPKHVEARYLLAQMVRYAAGNAFCPRARLSLSALRQMAC
ncbi:MAG: hypothetical protein FJ272_13655, partial [Planctomycetes bacterium]|nr:hypothetical protein [Planctomycetota bacterium]